MGVRVSKETRHQGARWRLKMVASEIDLWPPQHVLMLQHVTHVYITCTITKTAAVSWDVVQAHTRMLKRARASVSEQVLSPASLCICVTLGRTHGLGLFEMKTALLPTRKEVRSPEVVCGE